MDKNKIKKFAVTARNKLRDSVRTSLADYGITDKEISKELPISTTDIKYYFDENHPVIGSQIKWRQGIVNQLTEKGYDKDKEQVFDDFVEEVAYTWFNRIIAIRFMEVNNYLPTRVRVLSNEEGKSEPEIIDQALMIEDDLGGYSNTEKQLIDEALNKRTPKLMDDLYAMLFIKQSDELSKILPGLFEQTKDYLKLLFVPRYNQGVIQDLITQIPESYFDVSDEGQVQIIGWLYQYYNAELKEKAFKKKKYQTSDIPAVTQLFTPDWIVKYMVENSLGRYWIDILRSKGDSRSEKEIADEFGWKYYMPSAEKNAVKSDKDLSNKELSEIHFFDPAMGSGHVLVYAFDVFLQIYETQGYSKREAAKMIIENNLYGLDIDTRAYQFTYFALLMKAREYNRRLFRNDINIHVYDIPEIHYHAEEYDDLIEQHGIDISETKKTLNNLVNLFKYGNDLGSIIKIDSSWNLDNLKKVVDFKKSNEQLSLLSNSVDKQRELQEVLNVATLLQEKYDVAVTNPPYMGGGKMDKYLKKYVQKNYPNSKADLFAVFMEVLLNRTNSTGYIGMVTMHSWMFLSNFEKLREKLDSHTIINMAHLGTRAFEDIGGEVVQTTAFILQKPKTENYLGSYERLVDYGSQDDKEKVYLTIISGNNEKDLYQVSQDNFRKIPGNPIAYWASKNLIEDFENGIPLKKIVEAKVGLQTGDNKKFLRQWFEVDLNNISFNSHNIEESIASHKKWFPYNKGGAYRKWYGNYDYVVNWQNDGYEIRNFTDSNGKLRSRPQNTDVYFKEAVTWSLITSSSFAMRFREHGSIHDVSGMSVFSTQDTLLNIVGVLNSKIGEYILKILNPTINAQIGNVINIPVIKSNVAELVKKNILLSKIDWNVFETSWDFQKSPLITENSSNQTLKQSYENWAKEAEDRFNQLKSNEEELNKIFIDLYGLQDELTPEEDDKDVSVRKADRVRDIKAFLSYFIGCLFGRYSLDEDGLIYAGGEWNSEKYKKFHPNKDNIILLTDRQYFNDKRDIIVRLKEFLNDIYSPESLSENLDFIAETLEPKKFEKGTSSEEIIRNYFINDFYKDHAKIYQKRPIYWEFNSGRNKGFKALMYLHRYNPEELAMVRTYLHDLQPAMNDLIEINKKLVDQETTAHGKSQYRKTITKIQKQLEEMIKYDQILDHLSQNPVELDLDDGVLVNHDKLQQGEKLLTKL